jgi:hypothetical protein
VSSFFNSEFHLTSFFELYFYINTHQGNKDIIIIIIIIIMVSKKTYSVLKFYIFISCTCSSVGSPSVILVKGKLSVQGFEGCQAPGSPTMPNGSCTVDHPLEVPV